MVCVLLAAAGWGLMPERLIKGYARKDWMKLENFWIFDKTKETRVSQMPSARLAHLTPWTGTALASENLAEQITKRLQILSFLRRIPCATSRLACSQLPQPLWPVFGYSPVVHRAGGHR